MASLPLWLPPASSYSFHPNVWPRKFNQANYSDVESEIRNAVDGNVPRLGRVWHNDPQDVGVDNVNATGGRVASHEAILIGSDATAVARLERYIQAWIELNGVGYEVGEGTRDLDPLHDGNTIGSIEHHDPAGSAPRYWVFGQNCFWWATSMLKDSGITIPASALEQILVYNNQVGAGKRYADNDSAKQILAQTPRAAVSKAEGMLRSLTRTLESLGSDGGSYGRGIDMQYPQGIYMTGTRQAPSLLVPDDDRTDHQPPPEVWQ